MSSIPKISNENLYNMSLEQIIFCFSELQKYSIDKIEELEEEIISLKDKNKKIKKLKSIYK